MSQAEALLNTLNETGESEVVITNGHILIDENRFIHVPEELRRLAVQYDHDFKTVTFDCPRYWDNDIDASEMKIGVVYMRPDRKMGLAFTENVVIDEENEALIHFDWKVDRHTTAFNGSLRVQVCLMRDDAEGYIENHGSTEINDDMYISEGMPCEEGVIESYPDIFEMLLKRMSEVEGGFAVLTKTVEEYNKNVLGFDKRITEAQKTADEALSKAEEALGGGAVIENVDLELDPESNNPIANSAVANAVGDIDYILSAVIDGTDFESQLDKILGV